MSSNKNVENSSCLQWGSNSRPLVYETSALPLSYRGFLFLFHGNNMTDHADFTLFVFCQIIISLKSLKQTYHWINELCHNGWDWSRKCLSHHDQSIVFAGIPERRKVIVSIQLMLALSITKNEDNVIICIQALWVIHFKYLRVVWLTDWVQNDSHYFKHWIDFCNICNFADLLHKFLFFFKAINITQQ